jgi:NAD(P)-dependent dehydrogenase (short-subunit alcohol dehydrogenase family)
VGKTVLITGGNSGIGFEAARGFLSVGATVLLACRSKARAEAALACLREEFPSGSIYFLLLDLAELASIDAFVTAMKAQYQKIDIALHCAGVYYPNVPQTKDGFPTTLGVNFTGTAYLAERLLPLMDKDGRMIFTTSLVDRFGKERKRNRQEKEGYAAYAASKYLLSSLCLRLSATRGKDEPHFIATHPGITATDLLSPAKTTHKPLFSRLGHAFLYLFTHSPEKATLTALLAATGNNGDCIGPRGIFGISGYPHRTRFCRHVRCRAQAPLPLSDRLFSAFVR